MPLPIEIAYLTEKAVLWASTGVVDENNEPILAAAVEIDVRWEEVYQEVRDGNGEVFIILIEVVVNRDIPLGSLMWLGTLVAWNASSQLGQYYVKTKTRVKNLKGRATGFAVCLMRYKDE